MTLTAAELYRRGRAHLNAGRNAAARRDLARAGARTDDTDLRARIAGSMAAVVIRQGDPSKAELICQEALAYPGLSAHTSAMLHGQLGLLALERGSLDEAVSWLDKAIDGIGDEAEHRAPMLLNRSLAHTQAGRFGAARADLERAVPDYEATGNDVERAMAVHNTGYVSLLEGDLISALATMAAARDALATASAVNAAICDLDRAEVLRDAGLVDEAEGTLLRVSQTFGAHRMPQARAEAEFQLARTLLASRRPAEAERVAAAAARRFRRVHAEWWAVRADGVRVRAALLAARPPDRRPGRAVDERRPVREAASVASEAARVIAELRTYGLEAEAEAADLTVELWRAESGDAPDRAGARAVRVRSNAPIQLTLLTRQVQVARALARGREGVARARAGAGLDALSDWQSSFGSLDFASSLALYGDGLIFAGLRSAARSMDPVAVFEWSERARFLSQQVVPLRPPPDPDFAADLAELRALRLNGTDWFESDRARELGQRLRQRQWSGAGAAGKRERASLEELQDRIDDDTASVSFVFDGAGAVAVAATRDRARVVRIDAWPQVRAAVAALRADVDVSAAVRTGPMAALVQRSLHERVAVLSAALMDPVRDVIEDRRLVLTVPGILDGVPWALLPALQGRAFAVATSASQWLASRDRTPLQRAAFAAGPRVARADEEVAQAASAWRDAVILNDERASVAAVTAAAEQADLLHVAAHGRHSHEHPLFSGLELADGTLFGYDIDLIENVPDTVILSACEVGRSSVRWGEEAIGMTRVWLHAGARCVVAAPVVVADDDACELLAAMHEGLADGIPPSVALAEASTRTGIVAPFQVHGAGF
ncbi:CHAT domain-containing protein [Microbacterium kyungheense]|uniref:CHAT domain-containing protein n=1 Tax=Microbacterium kyungheense TaxID=1263636 RepID=A0A543FJQ3_9MICO|nr:CHAT domain-containing protein [Microbacterium kyungheense]TQM33944.1 CHAT domain-containing protein [Microbacterium kyungheense]